MKSSFALFLLSMLSAMVKDISLMFQNIFTTSYFFLNHLVAYKLMADFILNPNRLIMKITLMIAAAK